MSTRLRRTPAMIAVLRALVNAEAPSWGLQICTMTGRATSSVYPLLGRLESNGIVHSEWEDDPDRRGARRRFYALTPQGRTWALEELRAVADVPAPAISHLSPAALTADPR